MSNSVEFSEFFKIINDIKEKENNDKKVSLMYSKLTEFENGEKASDFLNEMGQRFINIGVKKLIDFCKNDNLKIVANLSKEEWDSLADENGQALPQFLANEMIEFSKNINLTTSLADKWNLKKREVNKHIRPMAQYITEGIIDFLE